MQRASFVTRDVGFDPHPADSLGLKTDMRTLIIGAGVAGLVCARTLWRGGVDITVIEAGDGVGGRVRTDVVEGFRLDWGFQALFTAYPAARRQLDFERLNLRRYEPGAIICRGAARHILGDPLRDLSAALPSALTSIVSLRDKLLTVRLSADMKAKTIDQIMDAPDETTEDFLLRYGFSRRYVENFIRPFFGGGVFLDRSLTTSAKAFQFDWKMLAEGGTATPALGMGAISDQLAEELTAANRLRLNTRAAELLFSAAGVCEGARTADGEIITADVTIVATPAPEARRLTGKATPTGQVGTICLYFAGDTPVYNGKKILLHANHAPFVNNAMQITNVAPEHAPAGKSLLSVSLAGLLDGLQSGNDDELFARTLADMRRMMTGDRAALTALETYRPLRLYRIPYAQFAQPPGIYERLPDNDSGIPGVVFAGEFTAASSLNAAMWSGEKAAGFVLSLS